MQITARLDETTLRQLLGELLPVTIRLGEEGGGDGDDPGDRWIRIDPARKVDFVASLGLRVEVSGALRWKTVGVPMTIGINSAQILLRPSVVGEAEEARLLFHPELEEMDIKRVPGFIEGGITDVINKRLAREVDKMAWHFGRTLRARVPIIGNQLREIETFDLAAGPAAVEVTADAVVLTLSLAMQFSRRATFGTGAS
jgi:hypothetical protein